MDEWIGHKERLCERKRISNTWKIEMKDKKEKNSKKNNSKQWMKKRMKG